MPNRRIRPDRAETRPPGEPYWSFGRLNLDEVARLHEATRPRRAQPRARPNAGPIAREDEPRRPPSDGPDATVEESADGEIEAALASLPPAPDRPEGGPVPHLSIETAEFEAGDEPPWWRR